VTLRAYFFPPVVGKLFFLLVVILILFNSNLPRLYPDKVVKFSSKIIYHEGKKLCRRHQTPSDEPTGELNIPKNTLTKGYR
jgi:hypothetical protein